MCLLCVHLGTDPGSKAYRLIDPVSKRIVVSRDVIFDEDKGWIWSSDDTSKSTSSNSFEFDIRSFQDDETNMNDNQAIRENKSLIEVDDEEEAEEEEVDNEEEEHPQLRRSARVSSKPAYLDDYIFLAEAEGERLLLSLNEEPWDYNEAKELKVWTDACKDEIVSIEKNDMWFLVDLPV